MTKNKDKKENRQTGAIGEGIACDFLVRSGFTIFERNYLRKWGEIDIIAHKKGVIHFVEVKSVTRNKADSYRPEENVHYAKRSRLKRTIQTYLSDRKIGLNKEFVFDIVIVRMNLETRRASVSFMENIIL